MTNLAIALMIALQSTVSNVSTDRLKVVSQDMVSVVNEEFANNTLKSSISEEEALHMLAAVAVGESSLRKDIESCKITGDGGRSVGLGQVMRGPNWRGLTRSQICQNRQIQFRLALHVIDLCWLRNSNANATFRCYTSGDPSKASHASKTEFNLYARIKNDVSRHLKSQQLFTCSLSKSYTKDYTKHID